MIEPRLGDCLEETPKIATASIDLVFLDPPFNVGKKYNDNGSGDKREDYYAWCDKWIAESFRVLKDTGTLYLMTIPRHLAKLYPMVDSRGVFINQVNWRNVTANHDKRAFWSTMQPILVYGKTDRYKFNTYAQTKAVAKPSWNDQRRERSKGQMRDYWDDIPLVYAGSIVHPEAILKKGTGEKVHPCQMPIALPERAILFSTDAGDTVLEPFMGVGATAVACYKHKRNYIGFDTEPLYVEITKQRIADAQKQMVMLPPFNLSADSFYCRA